jgi:hypothetical protein
VAAEVGGEVGSSGAVGTGRRGSSASLDGREEVRGREGVSCGDKGVSS